MEDTVHWFKSSYSSHVNACIEVDFTGLRPDTWSKSSASHVSTDSCVEVCFTAAAVRVRLRDSQDRSGPVLSVAAGEWWALVGVAGA